MAPNTSPTSSKAHSTFALIKNLDMGEFFERFAIIKVHDLAYLRIQQFLAKVTLNRYLTNYGQKNPQIKVPHSNEGRPPITMSSS